jgi:hypothetical protein
MSPTPVSALLDKLLATMPGRLALAMPTIKTGAVALGLTYLGAASITAAGVIGLSFVAPIPEPLAPGAQAIRETITATAEGVAESLGLPSVSLPLPLSLARPFARSSIVVPVIPIRSAEQDNAALSAATTATTDNAPVQRRATAGAAFPIMSAPAIATPTATPQPLRSAAPAASERPAESATLQQPTAIPSPPDAMPTSPPAAPAAAASSAASSSAPQRRASAPTQAPATAGSQPQPQSFGLPPTTAAAAPAQGRVDQPAGPTTAPAPTTEVSAPTTEVSAPTTEVSAPAQPVTGASPTPAAQAPQPSPSPPASAQPIAAPAQAPVVAPTPQRTVVAASVSTQDKEQDDSRGDDSHTSAHVVVASPSFSPRPTSTPAAQTSNHAAPSGPVKVATPQAVVSSRNIREVANEVKQDVKAVVDTSEKAQAPKPAPTAVADKRPTTRLVATPQPRSSGKDQTSSSSKSAAADNKSDRGKH